MGDRRKRGYQSFGLEQATPESMIAFADVISSVTVFHLHNLLCKYISVSLCLSVSRSLSLSLIMD